MKTKKMTKNKQDSSSKFDELFEKIKKCVGKNFRPGDEITINDAVEAIVNCDRVLEQIKSEGDIVTTRNGFTAVNQLYKVLKIWQAQKTDALVQLGLTPKSRKQITGSAESEQPISETTTGRKPNRKEQIAAQCEQAAEEFV